MQKICDDTPYVGKAKTKFCLQFNIYKNKHRSFRTGKQNVQQKRFHLHYIQDCYRGIDEWEVILFEKFEQRKGDVLATQIKSILPICPK